MQRRFILRAGAAVLGASAVAAARAALPQSIAVLEVWKSPTCGCCKDWIAYLQMNGFQVKAHDVGEAAKTAQRRKLGLAEKFGSCHTALVDGYVIEGHVPVREVLRLLQQRPRALGIAVPGMPVGSPGMDGPAYGGRKDAYSVLLVQRDGTAMVYAAYP